MNNIKLQRCPICSSSFIESKINTGICFVSKCGECSHEFTIPNEVFSKEIYDEAYFERTHKNWFANPQKKLFKKIFKLIEKHLPAKKHDSFTVLDAGCGKGALLSSMATFFPNSIMTGIDICEPPKSLDKRIFFKKATLNDLNDNVSFDVILSTAVIEHLDDPQDFILSKKKLLKKDGLIIVVTIDSHTPIYIAAKIMRIIGHQIPFKRLYDPHHLNHFTRRSLLKLAKEKGLEICFTGGINVPLKSLDIPSTNILEEIFYKAGVITLFKLGSLLGHPFLQLHVFKVNK